MDYVRAALRRDTHRVDVGDVTAPHFDPEPGNPARVLEPAHECHDVRALDFLEPLHEASTDEAGRARDEYRFSAQAHVASHENSSGCCRAYNDSISATTFLPSTPDTRG